MRAWLLNEGNQAFARLGQEARTKLLSVAYCTLFDCCLNPSGTDTEKADALPVVKQRVLHPKG